MRPAPRDGVDGSRSSLIPPVEVAVEYRGQQVVGCGDRVQIAVEVQVDVGHRRHLRPAAAGRAAFHAETWAQRRLAQAHGGTLAPIRLSASFKPMLVVVLPSPGRRRRHGGHQDQLAGLSVGDSRVSVASSDDLGLVVAVRRHRPPQVEAETCVPWQAAGWDRSGTDAAISPSEDGAPSVNGGGCSGFMVVASSEKPMHQRRVDIAATVVGTFVIRLEVVEVDHICAYRSQPTARSQRLKSPGMPPNPNRWIPESGESGDVDGDATPVHPARTRRVP